MKLGCTIPPRALCSVALFLSQCVTPCQAQSAPTGAADPALDALIQPLRRAIEIGDRAKAIDLAQRLHIRLIILLVESPRREQAEAEAKRGERDRLERHLLWSEQQGATPARDFVLPTMAVLAWKLGYKAKAESYAEECVSRASREPYLKPVFSYWGNHVLGLLASDRGDVPLARQYLLRSADSPGGSLAKTGPVMALAKRLLEQGQPDAVLTFIDRWDGVWKEGEQTLRLWRVTIQQGVVPDFGRHLDRVP